MKVGYLGPAGTFSQQAAEMYREVGDFTYSEDITLIPYPSIPEVISGADNGEIDEAVVPVENSIEGPVNVTLDMLAWDVALKIKREILVPVEHHLMVRRGTNKINTILSHPQAIGQCRKFLDKNFSNILIQYTYSTSQAAQQVAREDVNCGYASISARKAAEEYGLEILHQGIQDHSNNVTRFIVLAGKDGNNTGKTKTSLVFSTQNQPGSLYRILDILTLWDINMTRIESRPAKDCLGQYIFFVDIEGHREEHDVKDALTMIQRKTSFFKLLGSYPVD